MPIPVYDADAWSAAFQRLLPRGRVWPRDADAVLTQVVAALMPVWARLCARDAGLVADGFPRTAAELLPDWETSTGLPDPCLGASPSIPQRRAQLVARIGLRGGAGKTQFIAFAIALGFPIAITEYAAARFGRARFGDPLHDERWGFVWSIACAPAAVPLLSCEFARIKPAHTVLLFNFSE